MSYIPVDRVPIINPTAGQEREGDLKIAIVQGVKTVYIWLDNSWKQIYPAVFA